MGSELRPGGRWVVRVALIAAACNIVACLAAEMSSRDAWRERNTIAMAGSAKDTTDVVASGARGRETLAQFWARQR